MGILSLLILILGIALLPVWVSNQEIISPTAADTAWIIAMQKLEQKDDARKDEPFRDEEYKSYDNEDAYLPKVELFYFDPNTLSESGWKKLGLRDKTIHTIQNYLNKGGKFRIPEDLKRIYGLHPDEYERLSPFIKIENFTEKKIDPAYQDIAANGPSFSNKYSIIDINTADTSAFIALPGIGSKLALRIVNFRDKLGGFYSIDQVRETYGLADSTFQKIRKHLALENISIRKINLNTAGVDELKAHPYIRWSLANPIVAYRNEHGPFVKLEDIKKVMAVTEEIYKKIAPYLEL